jgi:hypothetical protein
VLIVVHEAHFFAVLVVEVVLARAEIVLLFRVGSCVRLLARLERSSSSLVLAQAIVEGTLARRRAVERSEPSVVARDVRVSAAAVVRVHHGLGVNVAKGFGGSGLLHNERT